jgi:pyridoxine 4-dehydrogenase
MFVTKQAGRFWIGDETEISRLGYGALRLLDVDLDACGPPAKNVDPTAILRRVVELGVTLIDTADIYGPNTNELQISKALYPYHDGVIISTKGGLMRSGPGELTPNYDPEHLRRAVEGSLRRLRLDQIGIWTLHHVDATTPIEEVVGTLANLRQEGKIRHIGLSKANADQLERARAIAPISMVQSRYNVADRRQDPVVEYCAANRIGFMAYFPLGGGNMDRLRECVAEVARERGVSMQQIALAWLFQRSPVIIAIPGTGFISELEQNAEACAIRLTADEVELIDARHAALPPVLDGPNPIKVPDSRPTTSRPVAPVNPLR